MLKIIVWMNMPSHHQQAFFRELSKHEHIDLEVRYYGKIAHSRVELGWSASDALPLNQKYIQDLAEIEESIPDWRDRIHVIPGIGSVFLKGVVELALREKLQWIHWSEPGGVGLSRLLKFNRAAISVLYPIFLIFKKYRKYANEINLHALGALAIGYSAERDFIKWGVKPENIRYLPYSLDGLETSDSIEEIKYSNVRTFCYLGSLEHRKGIDTLIKAFSCLVNKSEKWKLVIIGKDKTGGTYASLCNRLGIDEYVEFRGVIPVEEVSGHLSKIDVFVLPSRFDGWGAVLNEAAYLRKPLISTYQTGSAHHLIDNSKNGFIVNSNCVVSLTKAMQFYVDNPPKIKEHGAKSFDLVQKINPERCADLFYSNVMEFVKSKNKNTS